MPEKHKENLREAIRRLHIADHMTYVTFPLVSEHKLLLKILDEINHALSHSINAILNYEYLYKRIKLSADQKENMQTFLTKCAPAYNISNEHCKAIKEIRELVAKNKQSAMAFTRKDKVVIMSNTLGTETLDIRKLKGYLLVAKEVLMKASMKMQ